MKKSINAEKQVRLPKEALVKAQERARSLGLTLAEYVQGLVNQDARTKEYDPWLEPIPREVDESWERDIAKTEEYEKHHPRPATRIATELINLLDEEAARLPNDEGH